MTGRRGLVTAVAAVVAGAGLLLLGASRVWWTEFVPQPPPLRVQEIAHTGSSLAPPVPALALVALAGAGGLLAARGLARRLVGGLIVASAVTALVLVAMVLARYEVGALWPAACLIGSFVAGVGGALAVRDGARWPVMGARYSRPGTPTSARGGGAGRPAAGGGGGTDGSASDGGGAGRPASGDTGQAASARDGGSPSGRDGTATTAAAPEEAPTAQSHVDIWDALDRGEDPTRD